MAITLLAKNYRVLRETIWTPGFLSLVVGPNGAGKTTLLSLLELLRLAYQQGGNRALTILGGSWGLRHFQAQDEAVVVGLTVDDLEWELELPLRGTAPEERWGESVKRGGATLLRRALLSDQVEFNGEQIPADERTALRTVFDARRPVELLPLIRVLERFRVYNSYNLYGLRVNGSRAGSDSYLNPSGENAFTVMRNWRDRREHRPRYDFVMKGLRAAFPELFAELNFDLAGLTVSVELVMPDSQVGVPAYFAPNGWLTGLLHLCAVAGTEDGGLVAIDELENTLHPFAIRKLVEAFGLWAEDHDVTVCMATHSPVLIGEFKDMPEQVFVMQHGCDRRPLRLTELREPEWLAHFALGDLYSHGDFGGQRTASQAPC
jgi:predicted ATPase